MSALEEKARAIYWFYRKLRLFGEPVFFVVIVVLTTLYSGQIWLEATHHATKASNVMAALKAATFYLTHHSVGIEICFSLTWLSHWFYFWRKMKEWPDYTLASRISHKVVVISIGVFVLILLFLVWFHPDTFSPDALKWKRTVHQAVRVSMGFLFPFILVANVWFWLAEMYELASDEVWKMVEEERRKLREAARAQQTALPPQSKPLPPKINGGEKVLI